MRFSSTASSARICAEIVCTAVRLSSSFWREAYSLAASASLRATSRLRLLELGARTREVGLGLLDLRLDAPAVELEEDVALLDRWRRPRSCT